MAPVYRVSWALIAHTTHQKVSFRKASQEEQEQCLKAFEKEMSMFENYEVYTTVKKQDLPWGARVVAPVVVFTKKLR